MNKRSLRFYEFGPFRINVTERLLQRSDEAVPLTPKVFDTLLVLVENSGHVLGKNELMQALWPDSFVEESSLTQNISLLRRALSESGDCKYIETIPKRGYRFVANVQEVLGPSGEMFMQERISTQILVEEEQFVHDSEEPAAQARTDQNSMRVTVITARRHLRLGVFAGAAVVLSVVAFLYLSQKNRTTVDSFTPRSMAVLPFKRIGPQTDTELLSLGMANALIIKLLYAATYQTKRDNKPDRASLNSCFVTGILQIRSTTKKHSFGGFCRGYEQKYHRKLLG